MIIDLSQPVTQQVFAGMVGFDRSRIPALMKEGVLKAGDTCGGWLLAYCAHMRLYKGGHISKPVSPDTAGDDGETLNLTQEKAALARQQRIAVEYKNQVTEGSFAPIALLADVLATASSAVVDRFDQLESTLRKACPDLDPRAVEAIQTVIANARNEWIRSTTSLVAAKLETQEGDQE